MSIGHDAGRLIEGVDRPVAGQGLDRAGAGVDLEQAVLALVRGGDVERPAVRTPGQARRPAIPVRQLASIGAAGVGDHDHGLVPADVFTRGRQPGQATAVGREGGIAVAALVALGQIDRRAAVQRDPIQVAVVGEGLARALLLGRIDQGLAVARQGEVAVARRHVGIQSRHQVARLAARQTRAVQRLAEQVSAATIGPVVEHAQRQTVIGLQPALGALGQTILDALQGGAVGEDRDGQDQRTPVLGDAEARDVDRQGGHLGRRHAVAVGAPDLVRSAPRRQEIDGLTVRRPARARDAAFGNRQLARRRRAVSLGQPQGVDALVAVPVGRAHGVENATAVGRYARIADPLHHRQLLDPETGAGGRGLCGGGRSGGLGRFTQGQGGRSRRHQNPERGGQHPA